MNFAISVLIMIGLILVLSIADFPKLANMVTGLFRTEWKDEHEDNAI